MIRTSLGEPAAAPTETHGCPRVRIRPATVRAASLALKRDDRPLQAGAGLFARLGLGPADVGSRRGRIDPAEPLGTARQSSQTSRGPSLGLM